MKSHASAGPKVQVAALVSLVALLCIEARAEVFPKELTNSLGMEFVLIGPGTFEMGQGADPKLSDGPAGDYDEQPAHVVTITRAFYLTRRKVSKAAYQEAKLLGSPNDASWNEAAAFCRWLSGREKRNYRLPTEAEWECAFKKKSVEEMNGREWVQDWHGLFSPDPVKDPLGPLTGTTKVIRDGAHRLSLSPDAKSSPWELKETGFHVVLEPREPIHGSLSATPFAQAAVKQNTEPALQGPDEKIPYFTVRFALPIPPENDVGLNGPLTGLDQSVMMHQHSPGFEVLPNGDLLAVYFSARNSRGTNECEDTTRFVQARLRYGAEEWDPPELFCDFKPFNDQSGLLWRDGNTVRFFGGGRGASPWLPFKMGVSTNNGATWTMSLPLLDVPSADCAAQPIVNAFRSADGAMFFGMDGGKDSSFLWRSTDNGIHWHDMGGRTGGRHSTIIPLGNNPELLSIGGKHTSVNGWSPENRSSDWGAHWSEAKASPFPTLAGNQRPCLIRLANGHLCFASDSYNRQTGLSPEGWEQGQGCIVAVSTNNGANWRIKRLPVELPHEADKKNGTLGYATVRQAPNGVIHVLATMTHPCIQYEFNEAWIFSDAGDISPESTGGTVRSYRETYPDGTVRATWTARICQKGRYLLDGLETTYYPDGQKEHQTTYVNGRKKGEETFWAPDGAKLWSWKHDPEHNSSVWVHYWHDGGKRIESRWQTESKARDLDRKFIGLVAEGPAFHWNPDGKLVHAYSFTNGGFAGPLPLESQSAAIKVAGKERGDGEGK